MLGYHFWWIFTMGSALGTQIHASGKNPLINKHLKVAAEHWSPLFHIYCNKIEIDKSNGCSDKKGNMTYGGALWDFLSYIKLARNVTITILRPPTPTWGFCYSANNCTGMIGMVNRREVDFALGISTHVYHA